MNLSRYVSLVALITLVLSVFAGCSDDTQAPETSFFAPDKFGVYEFEGEPNIESVDRLNFGDVPTGMQVTRILEIQNTGREALTLYGFDLPERYTLSTSDGSPLPERVERGETVRLVLTYEAVDDEAYQAELIIDSDDPDTPKWTVLLLANVRFPCVEVSPENIDFGIVEPGVADTRRIRLESCSPNADTVVSLVSIEGSSAFFVANNQVVDDIVLLPGESVDIEVAFRPSAPGPQEAIALFQSDDPFAPEARVLLQGSGKEAECPVAIIQARGTHDNATASPIGTYNGLPLDRITLDGSASFDPENTGELTYEWTIVRRPTDSAARLEFDADLPLNEIWLDLAGEYTVQLNVRNAEGVDACQPARMRLLATADQDIHVQLVWDTPNDPDQSDTSGSDVDLHLLHPLGQWNISPYDCFWQNLEPDWGQPRRIAPNGDRLGYDDDPSLDIDDVDGWGPENINLDNPESLTYDVGVHYFADHGYSISFVTVRIYIGGVLFREFLDTQMRDQDFWHVAKIEWPGGGVQPIDVVSQSFP